MKSKITTLNPSNFEKTGIMWMTYFFLMLLSCSTLFAQTIVERAGRLQVTGSHVTSESGQVISLAGNSMFWSNAGESEPFYNAQTVNHLADDWNGAIIRPALGVKESWDGGNNYINNRQQQEAKIRKVIDAAIAKGVYVIIDWHTHEAENYSREAIQFFSKMADIYGEFDNVIYEIYNEPLDVTAWNTVKNYAGPVIEAIRAKDPDNLIIVGTRTWCQEVEEAANSPINGDPNLAYTMHYYADSHKQFLRDRVQRAMNKGIAIFVTEFGTTDFTGDNNFNKQESNTWFKFLIDNGISYVNWNVSDKNEDSSVVRSGAGLQGLLNGSLTESGAFIRDHMRGRDYSDIIPTLSTPDTGFNSNTIEVYPNPAHNTLFVKNASKTEIEKVSLFDITGRLVLSKAPKNNDNVELNIQDLSKGSYILKLESAGNTIARKIIKQ